MKVSEAFIAALKLDLSRFQRAFAEQHGDAEELAVVLQRDVFTMRDAQEAAELLRENNVLPDADGYYRVQLPLRDVRLASSGIGTVRVTTREMWSAVDALRRRKPPR